MTVVGEAIPSAVHTPTAVQLFRFSAATWNAHRIHYDSAYAREEGYPDVLVQSHLHASLLARFVLQWAGTGARLSRFRWENRAIAVPGDELRYTGVVTAVRLLDEVEQIECELSAHRSDRVLCAPAWATVVVPRR